ncbi:hypothetical protein [Chromobacterium phragmitis]|uniref:hypothetical protein n=1 Tax=Chromobacterium phragmitis TaxID=2202141 RepID=UPI0011AEBC95|nr:hypothetical protein [Chromobacterium phragmitis]
MKQAERGIATVAPCHAIQKTRAEQQIERLLGATLPDDMAVSEFARLAIAQGFCLVQVAFDLELRPVLTVVGGENG